MPEWGMLPIPKKLLAQGVRDMVRVSDARMSGTSYGTCVLHVADDELERRRASWVPREPLYPRGFGRMYAQHVTQADRGCDFDFLEGTAPIEEPEIH